MPLWKTIFIVLIFSLLCPAPAWADSFKQKLAPLVQKEWKKIARPKGTIQATVFWNTRISPAFPCDWPVQKGTWLCYYAFPYAFDPRVADGEKIALIWGKGSVDPSGKANPELTILLKEVKELGNQGVRPLTKVEVEILKKADDMEHLLAHWLISGEKIMEPDLKALKEFYCLWFKNNGVISPEIRKFHPDFIEWLGCGEKG